MTKYKCVVGWSVLLSIVIHSFKWLYAVFCQYLQLEFQLTVEETQKTWRVYYNVTNLMMGRALIIHSSNDQNQSK